MRLPLFASTTMAAMSVAIAAAPLCGQQRPTAGQRIDTWQRERPDTPIPANLQFGRLLPDVAVTELVQRHSVTPVAVYMYADGLWATHRVAPAKAGAGTIGQARQILVDMMRNGLRGAQARAQGLQREAAAGRIADNATGLRSLTSFLAVTERERAVIRSATGGQPIIYAIDVIGDVAAIRSIIGDALVREAEPAFRIDGRTRVPRGRPPAEASRSFAAPAIDALRRTDALTRIGEIAQNGLRENP